MAHDVFISYSVRDKSVADALCSTLENNHIRCWMAPRDILPAMDWSDAIVAAIEACTVFVLIFSGDSNLSKHVKREVEIAVDSEKYILPFKIENVDLSSHMRYFIKTQHWLDAITPPLENHLLDLVKTIHSILNRNQRDSIFEEDSRLTDALKIQKGELMIFDKIAGLQFSLIEGSDFNMGDVFGDADYMEKPVHRATVFDYYLSTSVITNEQFAVFLGDYGSSTIKSGDYAGQLIMSGSRGLKGEEKYWEAVPEYEAHPVVQVTWYGALEFCRYYDLRLPTEAEWEFAARSGGKMEKWAGTNNITQLKEYAWYAQNSDSNSHQVNTKKPNHYGIYDMSGNVWEWCNDWYGIYSQNDTRNPQGPSAGSGRVIRGGSWLDTAKDTRTTARKSSNPSQNSWNVGFRVALSK
ncbi:MAG TPA: SUMF1/EgtB/PvdO family nonheme iron enzyme [bacterium]|mgnify:FL=1|nr:SUMF1/EgtB/PvdO family nonheme iron enzyme [bacterium]